MKVETASLFVERENLSVTKETKHAFLTIYVSCFTVVSFELLCMNI